MEAYIDLISRPEGYMDLNAVPEPAGGGVALTDTTPYLYRISADGQNIGSQEFDEIVGGTVAWNQMLPTTVNYTIQSGSADGLTIGVANGYIDITGTASSDVQINPQPYSVNIPANHVCLLLCDGWSGFAWSRGGFAPKSQNYYLNKHSTNFQAGVRIYIYSGETHNIHARFSTYDLTQIFGSTIADYIYSLEQSHAGDGVALFRKFFNKPYYAYNSGELISSLPTAHETVGFNAWDEEWELGNINGTGQNQNATDRIRSKNYIRVIPNATYYYWINSTYGIFTWGYDLNKNYVGRVPSNAYAVSKNTVTIPSDVQYIRFVVQPGYGTTYNNDICINLSWDGERDGEYEPYVKHTYPISEVAMHGIWKLDANNKIYCDGDIRKADGTLERRYGVVDLGSLNWTYVSAYSTMVSDPMDSRKMLSPVLCAPYVLTDKWISTNEWTNGDKLINSTGASDTRIRIKDTSYTNATAFKTAMNGVYLVYELATPTSETATPYTNPQYVAKGGTEEYVDTRDVPIPVGHNTKYQGVLL